MRKAKAFTLIELLVVVAIIALLIAILLPSLGRARENARIVVCGTHMRQIATANLMYIDDNKGALIFSGVISTASTDSHGKTLYPNGQFWATDLAAQGYLPSKNNILPVGGSGTAALAPPSTNTIFYCPDGLLVENPVEGTSNMGLTTQTGNRPRSEVNQWYMRHTAGTALAGTVGVYSWYGLNAHNVSNGNFFGNAGSDNGGGACPFVQWNSASKAVSGVTCYIDTLYGYGRRLSMITAPGKMVMVLETSNESWDTNNQALINHAGETALATHALRLAGRHGDVLNGGVDGSTNFAYFDGHVAKAITTPYSTNWKNENNQATAYWQPGAGFVMKPVVPDTIFYFQSLP